MYDLAQREVASPPDGGGGCRHARLRLGGVAVCTLVAAGKQPIVAWPDLGLHNPASRGRKPTTVPGSAVVLHDSSTTDAHGV